MYFMIYCTSAIDFYMCNYDNIFFWLFNWGSPFLISSVAELKGAHNSFSYREKKKTFSLVPTLND